MGFLDRQRTGWLCLCLAIAFLAIGWWPFAPAPRNRVAWARPGPGLSFEPPGIAHDERLLPWSPATAAAGFTVELRLEAGTEPRSHVTQILTIHDEAAPTRFALCQWKSELILRVADAGRPNGFREGSVKVLQRGKARTIAVACRAGEAVVYVDGREAVRFPRLGVPEDALRGRLVLGEAPGGKQAWTGIMRGVAVHPRALDAREAARRHKAWVERETAVLAEEPAPSALFLLEEGAGESARSGVGAAAHRLEIPARYQVLQPAAFALARDWEALWRTEARDLVENLVGFTPFGLLVCWWWRLRRGGRLGAWAVGTLAGGALSLLIETGQIWLPTRVSSATDLMLNTAGAALGAAIACVFGRGRRES